MSNTSQLGFDHLLLDLNSQMTAPTMQSGPQAANQPNLDWIPPPASLTTVNYDGMDLNDEIFFNYNTVPSYTPYTDPYAGANDAEVLLLTLLLGTLPYNALQLAITTPDMTFASPLKFDANLHYHDRRRFSLAVEQLNRMSLRPRKLRLPSPDVYPALVEALANLEERTINPRQLWGNNQGAMLGALPAGQNNVPSSSSRYILPSSVLSPSLSTFFSRAGDMVDVDFSGQEVVANGTLSLLGVSDLQGVPLSGNSDDISGLNPQNSYVMNDECVSAITYWLNNTENIILDKADGVVIRNPTGIVKPNWKRRNSIQVLPNQNDFSPQRVIPGPKKKRRKSVNASIPEDTAPPQVYPNSQLPGVSHSPQFQPMTPLALDDSEPKQNLEPTTLREDPETTSGSSDSLKAHETPRYGVGPANNHVLDAKPATGHASIAEGDDEPKPFPCPDCDKQFKRLEHLKRHIRSVHLNIRPFHCKYCDKKFLRSDNLAQHSKTHFKVNANGTTTIIYGNPSPHNRGGRKKSISSDAAFTGVGQDSQ